MEKKIKHLVVAISGIGLCYAGQLISTWAIPIQKNNGPDELLTMPFTIIGTTLIVVGLFCCLGALLCQTGRYDKKK